MKRRNSALMAEHAEGGSEQIGGNVPGASRRHRIDQDFSASTYQIACCVRNAKEQLGFVALALRKFSGDRRKRLGDAREANDDVYLRGAFAAAGYESRQRQVRPDAQSSKPICK